MLAIIQHVLFIYLLLERDSSFAGNLSDQEKAQHSLVSFHSLGLAGPHFQCAVKAIINLCMFIMFLRKQKVDLFVCVTRR